jgi:hypothetical protein
VADLSDDESSTGESIPYEEVEDVDEEGDDEEEDV